MPSKRIEFFKKKNPRILIPFTLGLLANSIMCLTDFGLEQNKKKYLDAPKLKMGSQLKMGAKI
jgi:hypothetical protein